MPTLNKRNRMPKPRKIAPKRLIRSSLIILVDLVCLLLDISYTKNHAVKKIPIDVKIVAKCGYTVGLIGDTCLTIDSILIG